VDGSAREKPTVGVAQKPPPEGAYADLLNRAARFRRTGSIAFLFFSAGGVLSVVTHMTVLAGAALLAFIVFMVAIGDVWFAGCPACGASFFCRTVSVGPLWSYGPWGVLLRRPRCADCGYPANVEVEPEGSPDSRGDCCPACSAELQATDEACPECGLRFS
jgi:hypothetical protein